MPERRIDPFPMKGMRSGEWVYPEHSIPWYLAEFCYARLVAMNGPLPPLEYLAQNKILHAANMLDLMAGGNGAEPFAALRRLVSNRERSIINNVQIVIPGTRQYDEAVREMKSEARERERKRGQIRFYGSGSVYGDGQAVARPMRK
jgi:hypothetical protein